MKANVGLELGTLLRGVLVACALGTSACGVGDVGNEPEEEGTVQSNASSTSDWNTERARRALALVNYIQANEADFKAFKNGALGNSGIPMVMFRLFPEVMPEIWGAPTDYFAPVGLSRDILEPNRVLPLGVGFTGSVPAVQTPAGPVNVQVVQLTCAGCHSGRVVGPGGIMLPIIGGPNTTFSQFGGAVFATVNSPKYTADIFRAALLAKPANFIFGDDPTMAFQEQMERAIFLSPGVAETMMGNFKAAVNGGAARTAATLGAYTYNVPNAPSLSTPKPGYLDAIGAGIAIIVNPANFTPAQLAAILPPAPAEIDIMSVWRQNDRPVAQWDGSIGSPLHRNLAAEFGVVKNPAAVSLDNAVRTTRFTANLPATPYPFDVDNKSAARGKVLYDANCASCHAPGNSNHFAPEIVGTDANRAILWTPFTIGALTRVLRLTCPDATVCNGADGLPLPDSEIVNPTYGYGAVPLDGIWARAPYLHNGSVPTLHALLTGIRPVTFYRGNLTFDQKQVGFTWDRAAGTSAAIFDTRLSGSSNTGHYSAQFNGNVDWKNETGKLKDLLEYLKTL